MANHGGSRDGAGRKPGSKNEKTLVIAKEHEALQQMVLQNVRPLFDAQLSLAKGISHVYRVSVGPRGGRTDPELVTSQDELHDAIQAIHAGGGYGDIAEDEGGEEGQSITHRYYFVTTKAPDNKAIDSLLDRAFGKSVQRIAGHDGGALFSFDDNTKQKVREAWGELVD
jgi:hypothetical protein